MPISGGCRKWIRGSGSGDSDDRANAFRPAGRRSSTRRRIASDSTRSSDGCADQERRADRKNEEEWNSMASERKSGEVVSWRRPVRSAACLFGIVAPLLVGTSAFAADDGPPDLLTNGSFEEPDGTFGNGWQQLPEAAVPGWRTSAKDHVIEIQNGQLLDGKVPPDSGKQYAELNANEPSSLYQDVRTIPGSVMRWKIAHRGRRGVDVMQVRIGTPTGELVAQVPEKAKSPDLADGKTAWGHYEGYYTVPEGQTVTRFAAASVSTSGNDPRRGNLVDSVSFVTGPVVSVTKTVAGPQGRRGVAVGDELTYTVKAANTAGDTAEDVTVNDEIPEGTAYVPGSLTVDGEPVTDGTGDDAGEVAEGKVTVRLGGGADQRAGGKLAAGSAASVAFRVRVTDSAAVTEHITNTAQAAWRWPTAVPRALASNRVDTRVTRRPEARDDAARTDAGTAVTVDVLANDTGEQLRLTGVTKGEHGTAEVVGGKVRYTPDRDFHGIDSVTYTATDGAGRTVRAVLRVTVEPPRTPGHGEGPSGPSETEDRPTPPGATPESGLHGGEPENRSPQPVGLRDEPAAAGGGGGLARTGASAVGGFAVGGAAFLAAGLGLAVAARRRR
ncbi:Ig-like domain-containing protein [Kitasatospora sp. NPDC057940]|uniref:Ig-like domain-containing protein n=1 Tax=Kitasatospora sp. NPDC057940 TaxID=3346285 RepID=UPI0036DE4A6B